MKLSEKEALDIAIELWGWMTETGSDNKEDWPGWEKYGRMLLSCPLCKYCLEELCQECKDCIIYSCVNDYAFGKWEVAKTKSSRKKYAGLFLAQLKEVRDGITSK